MRYPKCYEEKKYKHLSLTEREKIGILDAQGKSIHETGKVLNRDPSTISKNFKGERGSGLRLTFDMIP